MNIRFEYLYRDAGNFKNWGEVVFSNPDHLSPEVITQMARAILIDQSFFVAEAAEVPDLHFSDHDDELDHGWHEMHAFASTDEEPNDREQRNIQEFVESLRLASVVSAKSVTEAKRRQMGDGGLIDNERDRERMRASGGP